MSNTQDFTREVLGIDIWRNMVLVLLQDLCAQQSDDALDPTQWALLRQWSYGKDAYVPLPPGSNAPLVAFTIANTLAVRSQLLGTVPARPVRIHPAFETLVRIASLNNCLRELVISIFKGKGMGKNVFSIPQTPLRCACHSNLTLNNQFVVPRQLSRFIVRLELEQNTCLALSQYAASTWAQYRMAYKFPALRSLTYRFFGAYNFSDAVLEHARHLPHGGQLFPVDYLPYRMPDLTELRVIRSWNVDVASYAAVNTFFRRDLSVRPTLFAASPLNLVGPFRAATSEGDVMRLFQSDIAPFPSYRTLNWMGVNVTWAWPDDANAFRDVEVNDALMVNEWAGTNGELGIEQSNVEGPSFGGEVIPFVTRTITGTKR